jgi:ABC-type tungstate transport system substrate-binding protein
VISSTGPSSLLRLRSCCPLVGLIPLRFVQDLSLHDRRLGRAWTIPAVIDSFGIVGDCAPEFADRCPSLISGRFFRPDALGRIIALSLLVSLSATALATLFGTPLGAALAVYAFPGRRILVIIVNALLGLPPVVVGLALYLLLSRSGPLGVLALLFTPGAMVVAQALLALPIVTALVHDAAADSWAEYGAALQVDGATRWQSVPHLLAIARTRVVTAVLAGFGRTISELSFGNKGDLTVLVEGDPRLLNRYVVILLDPKKHPDAKQEPARRFADWLASPEGQAAIGAHEVNGEQLFHPSAAAPK